MKNILFTGIIAILSFTCTAQSISYKASKGATTGRGEFPIQMISTNNDEHVVLTVEQSWNKLKNHLSFFPAKGAPKHVEIGVPFDNTFGYDFVALDGKLYRFLLTKEKKTKKLYRTMVEYQTSGEIQNISMMDSIEYSAYKDMPAVRMIYSPDSSYILIADVIDHDDKKKDFVLRTTVLNRAMEIVNITEYKPTMKKSQKRIDCKALQISNDGTVYALHSVLGENARRSKKNKNRPKSDKRKSIANYHFELTTIDLDGKIEHEKLDHNNEFSLHEKLYMVGQEKPIIVAQINDTKEDNATMIGLNVMVYDPTTKKYKSNPHIFSKEEWEQFGYKSKIKGCGGMRKHSALRDQVVTIDGKHYFFSERTFTEVDRNGNKRAFMEEAVIFGIDNQGEIVDLVNIPKFCMTWFRNSASLLMNNNGKLAFLYHDSKRNNEKDLKDYEDFSAKSMFKSKKRNLVCALIDDSSIERQFLKDTDDLLAITGHHVKSADGSYYIPVLDTPSITSKGKLYVYKINLNHEKH